MKKNIKLAIIYDFDGTLSPKNMQEYDFIPALGIKPKKFWEETNKKAKEKQADNILSYMYLMIQKANEKEIKIKKEDFVNYGKNIEFFNGIEKNYLKDNKQVKEAENNWFKQINKYAKTKNIKIEHFIISSGLREMIQGTTINKYFKKTYASGFIYDQHNVAKFPAVAVNFTTKTQYLFRINKGCLNEWDNTKINTYTPEEERDIPFTNMIFIGDGETDIPAMKLVKEKGGHSIAVYKPNTKKAKEKLKKLIEHNRVDIIAPADYTENSTCDKFVKAVIDKVKASITISKLINK